MPGTIVFRSGRALWFTISTFLPLVVAIAILFYDPWYLALIMLPVLGWTLPIYFRTSYTIHDINQLTVVCGLLYKKTFNINDIEGIRQSNNAISSPALSLKRLELTFKSKETLLISPVEQDRFIQVILGINPGILVERKKRLKDLK